MSISGKYLTAKIDGVVIFDNYAWTATESSVKLGRTTGAFNGYRASDQGIQDVQVAIKGYMDVTSGMYAPVEAGIIIEDLYLYRDENDATAAFEIPVAKVFVSTQGGEVEGKIEWTSTIDSYGEYTYNDP